MSRIEDVNALKQYKDDYKLYAIYTCRERVMADVRDGLKPVARKVLVSGSDLGLKYPKIAKSARIVGDTMGKYHPHGDCLRGDTLVYCTDGSLHTIEEVTNSGKDLMVLAYDIKHDDIVPVPAHSFRIGQYSTEIYNIKFSNGYILRCTSNHPILGTDYKYITADKIEPGFFACMTYQESIWVQFNAVSDARVESIDIEHLDEPIPMYDFTVDKYENMFLPMTNDPNHGPNDLSLIVVHNSSIYGTMKPMSNDFEIKVPLINQSGAWGNKYGDEPSAMRYTEAGLSEFAMDVYLDELYKYSNCVDWVPNFDNSIKEPEVLPTALPILLVNGSFGIGVGLKIEIPKHNLSDVIDATIAVINDPTAPVKLIPDQCMPCEIIETDFEDIGNKGYGYFTVRGIIEEDVSPIGNPTLVVKSAPDLVYYETIDKAITKMIETKKLVNIVSTNHQGSEFIIEAKKGTDMNYIKQMLYQHTELQKNCRVSFEILDKDGPMRMSYKAYILSWLEYRKFTKVRIYYAQLQDVNTEMHKLEPYIKLAKSPKMDTILKKINKFKGTDDELIEYLIKELDITDLQSKFIINLRMKNITAAALAKYVARYEELEKEQDIILNKLTNDNLLEQDIVNELLAIKAKYGRKRICKVISKSDAIGIPQGDFKIVITENNCLKKLPANDVGLGSFKNDKPKYIIVGDNTKNLLLFTDTAKVFKIPIHKIGFSDKRSNGIDVKLLLKNCTSNINAVIYEPVLEDFMTKTSKYFIVTLSNNGFIKKMDIDDFLSANSSGLMYAKLDEGDYIKDIMVINHKSDVIVYTANKALRFSMDEVPYLKRSTKGNRAINSDDQIMGVSVVTKDVTDIAVVTKKGYVNRVPVAGLPKSARAKAPGRVIKLGKGDYIIGLYGLNSNDIVNVYTTEGKIDIPVSTIPVGSTVSSGTKMIKTRTEEILYSHYTKS